MNQVGKQYTKAQINNKVLDIPYQKLFILI
jgi:hypothetical protein